MSLWCESAFWDNCRNSYRCKWKKHEESGSSTSSISAIKELNESNVLVKASKLLIKKINWCVFR